MIVGIAAMMFVWLFGWGQEYFGWSDQRKNPARPVRLLRAGIISGYKTKQ